MHSAGISADSHAVARAATQGAALFSIQSTFPDEVDISLQWEPVAADPLVEQGSFALGLQPRERVDAPLSSGGLGSRPPRHSLSIDSDGLFSDVRDALSPQVADALLQLHAGRRSSEQTLTRSFQSHGLSVMRAGNRDAEMNGPVIDDPYAGFASPPPPIIALLRPRQTLSYQVRAQLRITQSAAAHASDSVAECAMRVAQLSWTARSTARPPDSDFLPVVHGCLIVSVIPVGSHVVRLPVRLVRSRVVVSAPPERLTVPVEPLEHSLAQHQRSLSLESLRSALFRRTLRTQDKPRPFGVARGSFELMCSTAVALVRVSVVNQPRDGRAVVLERVDFVKSAPPPPSATAHAGPNPAIVRAAELARARLPAAELSHAIVLLPGQRAVVNFSCMALRPGTHSLHLQVQDLCHASKQAVAQLLVLVPLLVLRHCWALLTASVRARAATFPLSVVLQSRQPTYVKLLEVGPTGELDLGVVHVSSDGEYAKVRKFSIKVRIRCCFGACRRVRLFECSARRRARLVATRRCGALHTHTLRFVTQACVAHSTPSLTGCCCAAVPLRCRCGAVAVRRTYRSSRSACASPRWRRGSSPCSLTRTCATRSRALSTRWGGARGTCLRLLPVALTPPAPHAGPLAD